MNGQASIYCRIVPRNSFPSLEKDINAILWQVPERRSVIAVGKPTNEIVNLFNHLPVVFRGYIWVRRQDRPGRGSGLPSGLPLNSYSRRPFRLAARLLLIEYFERFLFELLDLAGFLGRDSG